MKMYIITAVILPLLANAIFYALGLFRTKLALILTAAYACIAVIGGIVLYHDEPPTLEAPRFTEANRPLSVSFGGATFAFKGEALDLLLKGYPVPLFPYRDQADRLMPVPLSLSVEKGRLSINAKLYSFEEHSPLVEIRHNQFVVHPHNWDKNSNDRAFEVVNAQQRPVLQVIYKTDRHIQVHGILQGDGAAIWSTPDGLAFKLSPVPLSEMLTQMPQLKRIFKYPSWQYPGQFEDAVTQQQ